MLFAHVLISADKPTFETAEMAFGDIAMDGGRNPNRVRRIGVYGRDLNADNDIRHTNVP